MMMIMLSVLALRLCQNRLRKCSAAGMLSTIALSNWFPIEGNIFEWLIRKRHFPRNVRTTFCDYVILILWSSPQAFVVFAEL